MCATGDQRKSNDNQCEHAEIVFWRQRHTNSVERRDLFRRPASVEADRKAQTMTERLVRARDPEIELAQRNETALKL